MKWRLANFGLHAAHIAVIAFCLCGWIWTDTLPFHFALCVAIALSWFVLGPLLGKPGYCLLTGIQHEVWARQGRSERRNYVCFLFETTTRRRANPMVIERTTQGVFYVCALLSLRVFA